MDLAYELHDLVLTLDRQADAMLAAHGLNYNRYVALVVVSEHPGLTGRQLATALRISEPSTSAIIKRLITEGLIVDVSPAGSGHVRRLQTTAAGLSVQQAANTSLGNSLDQSAVAAGIDPNDLARTIHTLHNQIQREGPSAPPQTPRQHRSHP
ncbi:MarR family winged helix-turn-helix transcriptional regulator [Gordonia sp. CPCC 205333]|uniref:MarR family winged helix-turn-helix transcriptional regulator n=1 Tax=Gordonia sp. CPCC 205333 TaxID=3140790 RepID=UPI003AF3AD36